MDRADVATANIIASLRDKIDSDTLQALRVQITEILLQEFFDLSREVAHDRRLAD